MCTVCSGKCQRRPGVLCVLCALCVVVSTNTDEVYRVLVGNREWMKRNGVSVSADVDRVMQKFEVQGHTVVLSAINGMFLFCHAVSY